MNAPSAARPVPVNEEPESDAEYVAFHQFRIDRTLQLIAPWMKPGQDVGIVGVSPFDAQIVRAFPAVRFHSIVPSHAFGDRLGVSIIPVDRRVEADVTSPDLRVTRTFDGLLFLEVLEHLPAADSVILRNMATMLNQHGWLAISVPNAATFGNRLRLLFGRNVHWSKQRIVAGVYGGWGHIREYTFSEVFELLRPDFRVEFASIVNGYRSGFGRMLNILPRTYGNTILALATRI